jgi:hypothetical protein
MLNKKKKLYLFWWGIHFLAENEWHSFLVRVFFVYTTRLQREKGGVGFVTKMKLYSLFLSFRGRG